MTSHDLGVILLGLLAIAAVVAALYYRDRAKEARRISRREVVRKATKIVEEMFAEERRKIPQEERVGEYNAGYRKALADAYDAAFPGMAKWGTLGGQQSYVVNGHSLGARPDGRLTLERP